MQNTAQQTDIFERHNLRETQKRREILRVFQLSEHALTHQDIETALEKNPDRVTVYRTIQKFIEHGIIHQIEDGSQIFYALCDDCEMHDHQDDHLHFKCVKCDTIQCMPSNNNISFSLPNNYTISSMKVLLEGTCANCN